MLKLPVDRKAELMFRDDLVIKYIDESLKWFRNCFDEALTKEVEQLKKRVREKWNAGIYFPESTKQGVTDFWRVTCEPYRGVEDARIMGTFIGKDREDGIELIFASFEHNSLIHCPPHKIPILIDPTILTLKNDKMVKKAVWDIVKAEIGKQNKTIKGRDFAVPIEEPESLAVILRCHSETFEKYLRWYDLKKAGLSFRLIALIQFRSKPEDREQNFEEHIKRKKKLKIREPIKGESTIGKGFGIIYRAIFRTPAPTQEDDIPTSGKYNCPDHGERCSDYIDCAYREHWLADFDNKNKMPPLQEKLSISKPFE
jgi:hypothetical protein